MQPNNNPDHQAPEWAGLTLEDYARWFLLSWPEYRFRQHAPRLVQAEEAFIHEALTNAYRALQANPAGDLETLAAIAEAGCIPQRAALRDAMAEALQDHGKTDEAETTRLLASHLHVARKAAVGLCTSLLSPPSLGRTAPTPA